MAKSFGQVGGFEPDRSKPAAEERARLLQVWKGAQRAGYTNVAAELLELDSELFDVTDLAYPDVEWRDACNGRNCAGHTTC